MIAGFAVLIVVTLVAASSAQGATTDNDPLLTFRHATSAEKRATRPLAEAVVAAYRSGRFAPLCGLLSRAEVRRVHGSLSRCQQALRRTNHRCSNRCEFHAWGAFAAYMTARDKARRRTTLAWLYTMRDPRHKSKGELEIRFRKDGGRWFLLGDIVEAWSRLN